MLKEPQIYEEFQFFYFHSQLILIRHLLLDSLSKIVLNHERDNIANKKCKKASIIIQNLYIIYKQKPCIELSLYTWLFFTYSFLIGSYSSLFWFQIKHYVFLYFIILSFQNKRNIYREHQIRKMSTTAISRSVIEMLQGIETAILIRKAELTMLA